MKQIDVPTNYNYIGVFLTLRCNLNCGYCINRFSGCSSCDEMNTDGWIEGLSRIKTRQDLPISLQGGEPTIHPGFYKIVDGLYKKNKHLDLLTNGMFDVREFCHYIGAEVFMREAKYASLRFSFHSKTNLGLATKIWMMQNSGYEVGVWAIDHPLNKFGNDQMKERCKWLNIDYREKEFLGYYGGQLRGTYKYPDAIEYHGKKKVWCKPSEMLINPAGYIFKCHGDLYANRNYLGHILDKEVVFPGYTECEHYGTCNPCDIKLKTNRFQESGHCAVDIKVPPKKVINET